MKLHHRILSLVLAAGMAFSMTACSPMDMAKGLVVDIVHAMGLGNTDSGESSSETYAQQGGSVSYPEGFDTTSRISTLLQDGQLYISFNDIQLVNTDYFTAAGDSVTITAFGTTDETKTSIDSYKIALWELQDDGTSTTYVPESTVYITFSNGDTCYTHTISGLTPGKRYKATISFDSVRTFASGGAVISGLTDDALVTIEGETGEEA